MISKVLHFAFEYLERGWPVIPVSGKTPIVSWTAYQERRPTVDQVKQWFSSSERHNLAVVTGRTSGIVVIDCDSEEDATWWRENHAETPLEVITGRGGRHFYYRYPKCKVDTRVGILERKIDIRGEGALAVAPPSIHAETNLAYQWRPRDYYSRDEIPFFDPTWLGQGRSIALSGSRCLRRCPSIRNGVAYIRQITAESGNGGHSATFRAACVLRDSGLNLDEALKALRSWNKTNAKPPWTEKELAHKILDAYRE